jgi:uncharacterized membrane protein
LLWCGVLTAAVLAIIFVVTKIRAASVHKEPSALEMLAKFREMQSRGELSDAEFRTIKTTLTPRVQQESKDTGETR